MTDETQKRDMIFVKNFWNEFNRSLQQPEIMMLQWQQQNIVAVEVMFVQS